MDEQPTPFEELNVIEKAGYLGAAFFDVAERFGTAVLEEVARVAEHAVAAFNDEMDPNVEDAQIIDEIDSRSSSDQK